jgi:hypothetical protein
LSDYSYREILALILYKRLLGQGCGVDYVCDRLGCPEWLARRALREAEATMRWRSGEEDKADQARGATGWLVVCVLARLVGGDRLTVQALVELTGLSRTAILVLLDDLSRVTPLTYEQVVINRRVRQEWYLI